MKKSLKAFMNGIIDYAGLFPPAELALDPAIRNYAQYRKGDDAWMLSRFIIPANKLENLEPYQEELFLEGSPFDFSVLGKSTDTISDFEDEIYQVIDACKDFHRRHDKRVTTDILEVKLPKEAALCGDAELIQKVIGKAAAVMKDSPFTPRYIFYEGFFEESWKKDIDALIEAVASHNNENKDHENYTYSGFKLRCGGVEAHMFPSIKQVAFALTCARNHNVALKCTAGLHHPVRHYNDSVQTKMHGFFNIFGGAMLAYAHNMNEEDLSQILREEDHEQFKFSDDAFSWSEFSVSLDEVRELREVALISFGSCSFDEPREDLQKMGLM